MRITKRIAPPAMIVAFCLLTLRFAAGGDPAPCDATGVVLTVAQTPVAAARVYAVFDSERRYTASLFKEAISDGAGRFSIPDLPSGTRIRFYVRAEGHALGMVQCELGAGAESDPLKILLAPPRSMPLKIVDSAGEPIFAAAPGRLDWSGPNGISWIDEAVARQIELQWPASDQDGRLILPALPDEARVKGQILHRAYARGPFDEPNRSSPTVVPVIKLPGGVPFTLQLLGEGVGVPRNAFQFSMYRAGDDVPVIDRSQLFTIDADGRFQQVVPAGRYETILLRHPDLQTIPGMIKDFEVVAGEPVTISISIRPRGTVIGRVVAADSGVPLEGQAVEAYVHSAGHALDHYEQGPGWFFSDRSVTDAAGTYRLSPGSGIVRIVVRDRPWTCLEPFVAVTVEPGETVATTADLHRGPELILAGLVTDEAGIPVPRAVLSPSGERYYLNPICCDAEGRFRYSVEDLIRESPESVIGWLDFDVFDPRRPLGRSIKVELDRRQPAQELVIRLQQQPIEAPPKSTVPEDPEEVSLVGHRASELKFARSFGSDQASLKLADHRGQFVLLHFWATWCGPCKKSMPEIELAHELYGQHGLQVIGVHHNTVAASVVAEFLQQHPSNHPTVLDTAEGDICRDYAVEEFPTYVLIGPDGDVLLTTHQDRETLTGDLLGTVRRYLHAAGRLNHETESVR